MEWINDIVGKTNFFPLLTTELNLFWKSGLLMLLAALVVKHIRSGTPSIKFRIWQLAFLALLLLPAALLHINGKWSIKTELIPSSDPAASVEDVTEEHQSSFVPASNPEKIQPTSSNKEHLGIALPIAIRTIWLAGLLLLLFSLVIELLYLHAGFKKNQNPVPEHWKHLLSSLSDRMQVKKPVRLILSGENTTPFTFGHFQPVITLPLHAKTWEEQQLTIVLLHELAHIKRHDYLTNLLVQFLKAFYWFTPLVWHAAKQLRLEAESASDALVLSTGVNPVSYAEELLGVAKSLRYSFLKSHLSLSIARKSEMKIRIQQILHCAKKQNDQPSGYRYWSVIVIFLVVLVLILPRLESEKGLRSHLHPLDFPTLVKQTKAEDPVLRANAAKALGLIDERKAIQPLLNLLRDDDGEVKTQSLYALGQYAASFTFYPIKDQLQSDKPEVRRAALWALGQIGCLPAFRRISDHLDDPNPSVQLAANTLLTSYDQKKLADWLKQNAHKPRYQGWITEQFTIIQQNGQEEQLLDLLSNGNLSKRAKMQSIIDQISSMDQLRQLQKML